MTYKVCKECGEIPEYNHRDFQPVACCPTKDCSNHWPWTEYNSKDNPIEWLVDPDDVGQPCDHPGCLNHVTHPCEGCGRIAGQPVSKCKLCKETFTESGLQNGICVYCYGG